MKHDKLGKKIRTRTVTFPGMNIEYSLFRSCQKVNGHFSYSIVIDQSCRGEHEEAYGADVTREKRRADEMFSLISDGKVTVCTFFDVLEDIL